MRTGKVITLILCVGTVAFGVATGVPPIEESGVATWRPAVPADSVPRSIADAERHGAEYPRSGAPAAFEPTRDDTVSVGTAERRCVEVGDANVVRSGDLIARPFQLYAEYWRRGAPPKMTWATAHRARVGESRQLIIGASRLDAPPESHVFIDEVVTFRWPGAAMMKLMQIQEWHAAVIDPPSSGRWMLVATVGENWGCFVLDLPGAPPLSAPTLR